NAPNAAARALMQRRMVTALSPAQLETLAKEERNADLLPELLTKVDDVPYLLELTNNTDPKVVNTATGALEGKTLTDSAVVRLNEIFSSNSNPAIQQTALRVLLGEKGADDVAAKAWTMRSWNDGFRIQA